MIFSQAFDKALKHYGITGLDLSVQSGVAQNRISEFRNGGNISVNILSSLMAAMDVLKPGSSDYFLAQLQPSLDLKNTLLRLISAATDEEIEASLPDGSSP